MECSHRRGGHRFGFIHRLPSMFGNDIQSAATSSQTTKSVSVSSSRRKPKHDADYDVRRGRRLHFPFMSLPIEIRLQIYQYVYEMNPIHSISESMPWYPVPSLRPYPTQEIQPPTSIDAGDAMRRYSQSTSYSNDDSTYSLTPLSTSPSHSTTSDSNSDTFSATCPLTRTSSTSTWSSYDNEPSPSSFGTNAHGHNGKSPASLLPPARPYAKLPTPLLQTCRTIYHESQTIPFHSNEFIFPTWFASGLRSASTFTQKITPWQSSSLRWVRIELLSRDLETVPIPRSSRLYSCVDAYPIGGEDAGESQSVYMTDFLRLCGAWAQGLRGLRIKIMAAERVWFGAPWDTASGFGTMGLGYAANGPTAATGGDSAADVEEDRKGSGDEVDMGPKGIISVRDEKGRARPWVAKGLAMMKGLKQLEVELCPTAPLVTAAAALAMTEVSIRVASDVEEKEKAAARRKEAVQKLRWCADLEDAINERREAGQEKVRVVCVSKVLFAK